MSAVENYAGLVVTTSHLELVLLPARGYKQFENNEQGITQLINYLETAYPVLILTQADVVNAPVYHYLLKTSLNIQTADFSVVPQTLIVPMGLSNDAFYLANYATQIRTQAASPMNPHAQTFGILLTRRLQLLEMLSAETMRGRMMPPTIAEAQVIQQEMKQHTIWLSDSLQRIDHELTPLWRNLLDN